MTPDPQPEWRAGLRALHTKRAEDLFRLSLAASYAALFFLLDLEGLVPREARSNGYLLNTAWTLAWISVLAGSLHVVIETLYPLVNISTAEILQRRVDRGDPVSPRDIDASLARYRLWSVFHWLHLAALIGVFSFAAAYKGFNQ